MALLRHHAHAVYMHFALPLQRPDLPPSLCITGFTALCVETGVHTWLWVLTHLRMPPQAVQCVEQEVLWDAPDICLTKKDHLRVATYIFKVSPLRTLLTAVLATEVCRASLLQQMHGLTYADPCVIALEGYK